MAVSLLMGINVYIFKFFLLSWSDSLEKDSFHLQYDGKVLSGTFWETRWGQGAGELSIQNEYVPFIHLFFRIFPRPSAMPGTPQPRPLGLNPLENI